MQKAAVKFGQSIIYHSQLEADMKEANLKAIMAPQRESIVISTSALGSSINIPNLKLVIHNNSPNSLCSLIQQSGRAGRDGSLSSHVVIFNGNTDLHAWENVLFKRDSANINWQEQRKNLAAVRLYCLSNECRRVSLLNLFYRLQDPPECQIHQAKCDYCRNPKTDTMINVKSELQTILHIVEIGIQKFGLLCTTDELYKVLSKWKTRQPSNVQNMDDASKIPTENDVMVKEWVEALNPDNIPYLKNITNNEKREFLVEWLIFNGYLEEDILILNSVTSR